MHQWGTHRPLSWGKGENNWQQTQSLLVPSNPQPHQYLDFLKLRNKTRCTGFIDATLTYYLDGRSSKEKEMIYFVNNISITGIHKLKMTTVRQTDVTVKLHLEKQKCKLFRKELQLILYPKCHICLTLSSSSKTSDQSLARYSRILACSHRQGSIPRGVCAIGQLLLRSHHYWFSFFA